MSELLNFSKNNILSAAVNLFSMFRKLFLSFNLHLFLDSSNEYIVTFDNIIKRIMEDPA